MNRIKLIQFPNNKFELYINGLVAIPSPIESVEFSSTSLQGILTEIDTYLRSSTGQARLDGDFSDLFSTEISYINSVDSTAFDGTNKYKIEFEKKF